MGAPIRTLMCLAALGMCGCGRQADHSEWVKADANASATTALYEAQAGEFATALTHARAVHEEQGHYDHESLRRLALMMLQQGIHANRPEQQLMAIYGAGLSMHEELLPSIADGIASRFPEVQLASISILAQSGHNLAVSGLEQSMGSPYLPVRLEGAYALARRRADAALGQTEALMAKLPPEAYPMFAGLFAMIDSPRSTLLLHKQLSSSNELERCAATLAAAHNGRDELMEQIRGNSLSLGPREQEACAFALGILGDSGSVRRLRTLSQSPSAAVRVTSLQALIRLGNYDVLPALVAEAQAGQLYAISALADLPDAKDDLLSLCDHPDANVRANSAIALLALGDSRALPLITDLITLPANTLLLPTFSPGGALIAWTLTSSASEDAPYIEEASLQTREKLLQMASALPQEQFLPLAASIMQREQLDLVPAVADLLQGLASEEAKQILVEHSHHLGAPLIRGYSQLALYRMEGLEEQRRLVEANVQRLQQEELIRFRPYLPSTSQAEPTPYAMTAQEKSKLLIDSLQALAEAQDTRTVDLLVNTLLEGNHHNRYALAGILLLATL